MPSQCGLPRARQRAGVAPALSPAPARSVASRRYTPCLKPQDCALQPVHNSLCPTQFHPHPASLYPSPTPPHTPTTTHNLTLIPPTSTPASLSMSTSPSNLNINTKPNLNPNLNLKRNLRVNDRLNHSLSREFNSKRVQHLWFACLPDVFVC